MEQSLNKTAEKASQHANSMGREARSMASDVASRVEEYIPAGLEKKIDALRESTQMVLDRTEDLVKKHPFYSVLGAAAVGAIVASLLTSRSHWRD